MLFMELGVPNVTRFCSALLYARNRVSSIFETIFYDLIPQRLSTRFKIVACVMHNGTLLISCLVTMRKLFIWKHVKFYQFPSSSQLYKKTPIEINKISRYNLVHPCTDKGLRVLVWIGYDMWIEGGSFEITCSVPLIMLIWWFDISGLVFHSSECSMVDILPPCGTIAPVLRNPKLTILNLSIFIVMENFIYIFVCH